MDSLPLKTTVTAGVKEKTFFYQVLRYPVGKSDKNRSQLFSSVRASALEINPSLVFFFKKGIFYLPQPLPPFQCGQETSGGLTGPPATR